ncbi:MAG: NUDIX hydrolase [Dehalococcoidia bacterium]
MTIERVTIADEQRALALLQRFADQDFSLQHIVCVCASVWNDRGDLLPVQTPRRGWELPGGQVEEGEDLVAAVVREVREECTCEISADQLISVCSVLTPVAMVIFLFRGRYIAGSPQASCETTAAGWFSPKEPRRLVVSPGAASRLQDALQESSGLTYRVCSTAPFRVHSETSLQDFTVGSTNHYRQLEC